MNDHPSEQHDTPSSSEPPKAKDIFVSGAVPVPEEQEASSIAPGNPEPQTGVNIASMPDAGGGSSMQPESATESQSPATEEKPIAPETSPASNDAAEVQDPRPGVEKDNNTDSTAARPPDPPAVAKVKIHLVAVGSAPILKRTKFQIAEDQRFGAVSAFVTKMIKQPAFLYCNSCFCPSPDELLRDIRDCFAQRRDGHIANDELIVHYSLQEAWG